MKKIFTNAILALALFIGASVSSTFAVETIDLATVEAGNSGDGWSAAESPNGLYLVISITGEVTVTGTSPDVQLFVPKTASAKITLEDVVIMNPNASPLVVENDETSGGFLELTLVGENELIVATVLAQLAAVRVEGAAEITIKGDGQLKAYGAGVNAEGAYGGGAGIGSDSAPSGIWKLSGTINIESGTILAQGGYNAAGIGGGYRGSNGTINVTGGVIFTVCLGGGSHGFAGTINISGGVIYCNWAFGGKVKGSVDDPAFADQSPEFNLSGDAILFISTDEGYIDMATITENFQYYLYSEEKDSGTGEVFAKYGALADFPSFFGHNVVDRDPTNTEFENALLTLYGGNLTLGVPDGEVWLYEGDLIVPKYLTIDGLNDIINEPVKIVLLGEGKILAQEGGGVTYGNDINPLNAGEDYGFVNNAFISLDGVPPVSIKTIGESTLNVSLKNDEISVEGDAVEGLTIYSISGQTLISKAGSKVSVASLPKGAYVVSIATANGKTSAKFVK
ncbi:MAG: T9SS type A sorting domain-containing protein [Dysgonamonadaceae bacterium]|jgi:hypothetical protein|nr:T9SS type A sorting domain-containing protein [Dysgonamonadaceae bacterium]